MFAKVYKCIQFCGIRIPIRRHEFPFYSVQIVVEALNLGGILFQGPNQINNELR